MLSDLPVKRCASSAATYFRSRRTQRGKPQQLDEALADEQAWVVGYWQDDVLMGYALLAKLPFDAELQAIGVLPACQGQGIGQRLLNKVVAVAKQWQAERLLLEVRAGNQRAIALYQQAGFGEDGRRRSTTRP
ncbi:hypothetical protein HAALTHF_01930n [Vreelandella aquamarina]|nr:hypothetical protein HAALTHF_01930n [Halomonas axialensis]